TTDAREFFDQLSASDQAAVIRGLPEGEAAIWLRFLPPDDAADFLQAVAPEDRPRYERMLDAATLRETRALLAYAEDEAGGLMSPPFARVRPDVTADVAIRYLLKQTQNNLATYHYVYVLDAQQKLLGVISLRELFRAPADTMVKDAMRTDLISVLETVDQ